MYDLAWTHVQPRSFEDARAGTYPRDSCRFWNGSLRETVSHQTVEKLDITDDYWAIIMITSKFNNNFAIDN